MWSPGVHVSMHAWLPKVLHTDCCVAAGYYGPSPSNQLSLHQNHLVVSESSPCIHTLQVCAGQASIVILLKPSADASSSSSPSAYLPLHLQALTCLAVVGQSQRRDNTARSRFSVSAKRQNVVVQVSLPTPPGSIIEAFQSIAAAEFGHMQVRALHLWEVSINRNLLLLPVTRKCMKQNLCSPRLPMPYLPLSEQAYTYRPLAFVHGQCASDAESWMLSCRCMRWQTSAWWTGWWRRVLCSPECPRYYHASLVPVPAVQVRSCAPG